MGSDATAQASTRLPGLLKTRAVDHELGQSIVASFLQQRSALLEHCGKDRPMDSSRARLVVVLVAWEASSSMQTASMLERSLSSLQAQLLLGRVHADLLLVLNNGGGPTAKIRAQLLDRLEILMDRLRPAKQVQVVSTQPPPQLASAATPWTIDACLETSVFAPGMNQVLVIKQPHHVYNKGKIRGLRDVCAFLQRMVCEQGYRVDLVYQMDAETTLFCDSSDDFRNGPIAAMVDLFDHPDCQAVTTRDRYRIFDDHSAAILDRALPAAQLAFNRTANQRACSFLNGGSLMSRPASYLAAMCSLAELTPSLATEDYAYTSILRQVAKQAGLWELGGVLRLLGRVRHLNRIPSGRAAAMLQFRNWYLQAKAVDRMFPEVAYQEENFLWYCFVVARQRLAMVRSHGLRRALRMMALDLVDAVALLRLLYASRSLPDITDSSASVTWTGDGIAARGARRP